MGRTGRPRHVQRRSRRRAPARPSHRPRTSSAGRRPREEGAALTFTWGCTASTGCGRRCRYQNANHRPGRRLSTKPTKLTSYGRERGGEMETRCPGHRHASRVYFGAGRVLFRFRHLRGVPAAPSRRIHARRAQALPGLPGTGHDFLSGVQPADAGRLREAVLDLLLGRVGRAPDPDRRRRVGQARAGGPVRRVRNVADREDRRAQGGTGHSSPRDLRQSERESVQTPVPLPCSSRSWKKKMMAVVAVRNRVCAVLQTPVGAVVCVHRRVGVHSLRAGVSSGGSLG